MPIGLVEPVLAVDDHLQMHQVALALGQVVASHVDVMPSGCHGIGQVSRVGGKLDVRSRWFLAIAWGVVDPFHMIPVVVIQGKRGVDRADILVDGKIIGVKMVVVGPSRIE